MSFSYALAFFNSSFVDPNAFIFNFLSPLFPHSFFISQSHFTKSALWLIRPWKGQRCKFCTDRAMKSVQIKIFEYIFPLATLRQCLSHQLADKRQVPRRRHHPRKSVSLVDFGVDLRTWGSPDTWYLAAMPSKLVLVGFPYFHLQLVNTFSFFDERPQT